MAEQRVELTIQPLHKTTSVAPGTPFVEIARQLGVPLNLPCGGDGHCGKCRIRVVQGSAPTTEVDLRHISPEQLAEGYRLACQLVVTSPLVVTIPPEALATGQHQILTSTGQLRLRRGTPPFQKQLLTRPEAAGSRSLVHEVQRQIGELPLTVTAIAELARYTPIEGTVTALVAERRIVGFEPGDTREKNYGLAFDLGTTTLVASLVDVNTAMPLAVAARLNPQTQFGDDVISRIQFACERSDGLQRLQQAVREALNDLVQTVIQDAGISRNEIYQVACAGNTTMQHLLCGFHPFGLGRYPFTPVTVAAVSCRARDVGLDLHPECRLYVFPAIGGFVGGDTVAGILTSGLLNGDTPSLLVDLGTNGEIVVYDGQSLHAAATAAGPAFEGAKISSGMRAALGAIEQIWRDNRGTLRYRVIGNQRPAGLCGSALLDLLAILLDAGVIDPQGRLGGCTLHGEVAPAHGRGPLLERIVLHEGRPAFLVVPGEETASGQPIFLTQRDVRQLQLAIGAIRAGTEILLGRLGLSSSDVQAVYLAGGFANYIRRRHAQRVGLLPSGIPTQRIRFCGNTSLFGAQLALVSEEARRNAEELARTVHHVDLSTDPDFRWKFAEAMIFPDQNLVHPEADRA
ncbi:ASKHA domain-containing protein [Thermogutta sp.]|uniref:ASKHA domain-containing protein n=1 Tax=Thermogutta sp. TaxID=1962930 RepID=UPI00321FCDFC